MTSIYIYDPAVEAALPELPPLPIGALAVGLVNLLQQAADLPAPIYVSVSDTQTISLQFAPARASLRALTHWALRFGSVMTSQPEQGTTGTETWYRTQFDYYGVAVRAFAHIPASTANT